MKHLLILIGLTVSVTVFAQRPAGPINQTISLSGTIVDEESGAPLEYATVVIQKSEDPSVITGGITDLDGKFNIEIAPGVYDLRFEFLSYKSILLEKQRIFQSRDFGVVKLALNVAELEAVEVVGERTTVEVRLDKKIYNIGKDLTNSGATVSDALNNVPSVSVDVEGAISLRGNENVRILINGRPSALAGFGSTTALQQLPADAIERVEVITSPSARYDAEGSAGILNIILKREKTLGFNGSINSFIGTPMNSGITANGNLRSDNFNLFSTIGYRNRNSPGYANFDNTYTSGSFDRITEDRETQRINNGTNANIGMEYFLNKKSSITGSFFLRKGDDEDVTENNTERYIAGLVNSRTLREENQQEADQNKQLSFNYINNIDEEGQKLTADFQISRNRETQNSIIEERTTFPEDGLVALENVLQKQNRNEFLLQADYVLPMEDSQFEAGFRVNLQENATDYKLDSLNRATNEFVTNQYLSNLFTFNQDVFALYTQYGNKFGEFSFLMGLRLEGTHLQGQLDSEFDLNDLQEELGIAVNANFDKNYLGLFPTLNLIYELSESENISLGYNRRINRPRGWDINPFPSRSSRTNIFQGNPDLDPAYSNAFDLGYLKRWKKVTLTSSVYFQKETNAFERVQQETGQTTTDGIDIIRSFTINLSTNKRYGGEASIMYNPSRKLRLNGSFNIFKFDTEGSFDGIDYGASNMSWFARYSSKLTLPAKIEWQTNAFYFGPRQNSQTKSQGMFSISTAFSKDAFKGNGTFTLNTDDLLNSRKRQSFTQTPFFTSDSSFQWRVRTINLAFVYRFNEQKKQRPGRGEGGGFDDEEGQFRS